MKRATLLLLALAACSRGGEEPASQRSGDAATPSPSPAASEPPVAYASLTGDAAHGAALFVQCKVCHTVAAGQNRIGPTLHAVIGRPAASVPGYAYSPAMKASGLVWTEEELYRFLASPQAAVPGNKMAFAGLKKPQDRADLIAWLKSGEGE